MFAGVLHKAMLTLDERTYGFDNLWFTAGAIVSVAATVIISKPIILPTYQTIYDKLGPDDTAAIRTWRLTLGDATRPAPPSSSSP